MRRFMCLLAGVLLLVVGASVYRYATAEEGALWVGMTEEEVKKALGYPRSKAVHYSRTELMLAESHDPEQISQRHEVRRRCVEYGPECDWRNRDRCTRVEYDDDGRAVRWESVYYPPASPTWMDRLLNPLGYSHRRSGR